MYLSTTMETLLLELPTMTQQHAPSHAAYQLLKKVARNEVISLFSTDVQAPSSFAPFGQIHFPYIKMGAIDSLDLFGLDELIIFSFYWKNRNCYKKALDIGGNIGLHSIILNLCGFFVDVYEPDPLHFSILLKNLEQNLCTRVVPHNAAVSNKNGKAHFTRVLGNTTGSHLTGSKESYGEKETIVVDVQDIKEIVNSVDLIKLDAEGHEKEILFDLTAENWKSMDAMIEVGSQENAHGIFAYLQKIGVNAFSQKTGWKQVFSLQDLPTSHREGSLFITSKSTMPWG